MSCLALSLSLLIVPGQLEVSAAESAELDSWLKETGSENNQSKKAAPASSEEELKETSAGKKDDQSAEKAEQGNESGAQKSTAPESACIAVPAEVSAAVNAASPASASVPLLKGGVTYCVPRGTPLKLKLASVPIPQMKMEMKDEEGNLRPAQLDEKITAKITEDIYVDDNKVIPEGTIFYGKVSKISPPRHVGRSGHLELAFDEFRTPDGRTFAFRAEANNFKPSTLKSKMKGAGIIAAHAAGGAAVGALVAYKIFGMENTIAMHGYNIAGGAAVGCMGGIAWALWRRGPQAVLEPGDEFAMSIDTDLLIPAATTPTVKAPPSSIPGFEMEVLSKKTVKDGFGGHMIRLESIITNKTQRRLKSIDLFLEDDLGNRYPVSPDIDEEAQEVFFVQPLSRTKIVCTFAVEYPKLKHKLVWLDHNSHNVIFEQKI